MNDKYNNIIPFPLTKDKLSLDEILQEYIFLGENEEFLTQAISAYVKAE